MRNKLRIYSHNINGNGVQLLKEKLGCLAMHRNNPIESVTNVVNWGCRTTPDYHNRPNLSWLNHPSKVGKYSDKLDFFTHFEHTDLPILKTMIDDASIALDYWADGHTLYQRNKLNGHGGDGIVVLSPGTPMAQFNSDCELWTVKESFIAEYRVNVFKNPTTGEIRVLEPQRKRKVNGWRELENFSEDIRSEHTGWAFSALRDGDENDDYVVTKIREFVEQHVFGVEEFDLDFAGLDIGLTPTGDFIIIEINTAPGLGNIAGDFYANCIIEWVTGDKQDDADAVDEEEVNMLNKAVVEWQAEYANG